MPATVHRMPIAGSISYADAGPQVVLAERLSGYDTFLTGMLEVDQRTIPVRIITLDDVTVLRPVDPSDLADWSGSVPAILHLPHGARERIVPADLADHAAQHGRTLELLDDAELRYALTFLEEATTIAIREARIAAIVAALPPSGTAFTGEHTDNPVLRDQDRAYGA